MATTSGSFRSAARRSSAASRRSWTECHRHGCTWTTPATSSARTTFPARTAGLIGCVLQTATKRNSSSTAGRWRPTCSPFRKPIHSQRDSRVGAAYLLPGVERPDAAARFFRRSAPGAQEAPVEKPGDAETIVALVIHLRTGDEAMEAFTIATPALISVASAPPPIK